MAVKKESVEIKCPDCKIEFRLWVPTTHLTLWEGDEGERVNCVRCPTRFKIRKTLDGTKVFKLQIKIKTEPEPIIAKEAPSDAILDIAFDETEETPEDAPQALKETSVQEQEHTKTEEQPKTKPVKPKKAKATKKTEKKPTPQEDTSEPLIVIDEDIAAPEVTPAPPVGQLEEIEEILEIETVKFAETSAMGMTQHGETVLFVEDDKLSMAVAENSLVDLNIKLLKAHSGEKALEIIDSNHIDLLITDLHLINPENPESKIDGEHLLQLVADKKLGIPAVITTGKEMIDDIALDPKWFPLNVKGFVQKGNPFWSEELKDKVKELINKPA